MPDQDLQNVHAGDHLPQDQIISLLFVDDEQDFLRITKIFLERSGEFRVDIMTSAQEALNSSQLSSYDAIVSDYQMPGMNGIEFLKAVRDRHGNIPFILFIGHGREEIVIEAINNGADFYLQKGGSPQTQFAELSQKIRQAVEKKRAESSVIRSESTLRSFIESTNESVILVDETGTIIEWNASSELIFGIPKEVALGKDICDLLACLAHPFNRDPHRRVLTDKAIRTSLRTGVPPFAKPKIIPAIRPDGTRIYIRQVLFPIKTDKGFRFGSISQDISDEKRAIEALQESEERFRGMAERSSELILILDNNLGSTYVSPSARYIIGYNPEELINKPLEFFIKTMFSPGCHEVMNALQETMKGVIVDNREVRIRKKDGTPVYVNMVGIPVIQDGMITGVQVSMRDITKTKTAEKALRESEEKFRSFVENVNDILFSLTPDAICTYISPKCTELLGYEISEIIDKPVIQFIHPDDHPRNNQVFFNTLMKGNKISHNECRLRHKNGTWLWHSQTLSPISDDKGNVIKVLGISRDIAERKRSDDTIRNANRQLTLLSGITRHDILNKIQVILGYHEIIDMRLVDPELSGYLQEMKSATEMIQSQIEFTRIYQDLGSNEPQWIRLDTVMPYSSLPDFLRLKTDFQNYLLFTDPIFEKVFFNLLDNSIRHGERVTEINVSAHESGNELIVLWEDNGVGIAKEDKERIFDRGFGKNTGLGMFLVREILSLTGISIEETGEPGTGVRFTIRVPQGMYRRNIVS